MHIVFLDREREHDLRLELGGPEPTVGDLAGALTSSRSGGLVIAGHWFSPEVPLRDTGLVEGAKVAADRGEGRDGTASLEVRVVGGLKAGRAHALRGARAVVGRQDDCDVVLNHPSVSRSHCELVLASDGTAVVRD